MLVVREGHSCPPPLTRARASEGRSDMSVSPAPTLIGGAVGALSLLLRFAFQKKRQAGTDALAIFRNEVDAMFGPQRVLSHVLECPAFTGLSREVKRNVGA